MRTINHCSHAVLIRSLCIVIALILAACAEDDGAPVSKTENAQQLPSYEKESIVLSNIELAVTDETLLVGERLKNELHQQAGISIRLHSIDVTATEPWWLQEPTVNAAFLLQPMTRTERDAFIEARGFEPTTFPVARDAIAIIVHPSNPLAEKAVDAMALDAIFSASPSRSTGAITTWGELGASGEWKQRRVEAIARKGGTMTEQFREQVMDRVSFRTDIEWLRSTNNVIKQVAHNPAAIGIIARSELSPQVAAVEIQGWEESSAAAADQRPGPGELWLTLYHAHEPGREPAKAMKALLKYIYSEQGQRLLQRMGYEPVDPDTARKILDSLG